VSLNPSTLRYYNKDYSAPELNNFDFFSLQMSSIPNVQKSMASMRLLKIENGIYGTWARKYVLQSY